MDTTRPHSHELQRVLEHPEYRIALNAISEHRLAKARGDDVETARHLRRARMALDKVLRDFRGGRLP
jgi:hypothetical protein